MSRADDGWQINRIEGAWVAGPGECRTRPRWPTSDLIYLGDTSLSCLSCRYCIANSSTVRTARATPDGHEPLGDTVLRAGIML